MIFRKDVITCKSANKLNFPSENGNHLGNFLAVIVDSWYIDTCIEEVGIRYAAHITQATDYSAFGAPLPGRTWYSGKQYRQGFNGEEHENNLYADGMAYDLGARWYDARLGRMFSVDPLANQYLWQSPYAYSGNCPISSVDIDGAGNGDKAKSGESVGSYASRNIKGGGSLWDKLDKLAKLNKDVFEGYDPKGNWTLSQKKNYWKNNKKYKENFKENESYKINESVDFSSEISSKDNTTINNTKSPYAPPMTYDTPRQPNYVFSGDHNEIVQVNDQIRRGSVDPGAFLKGFGPYRDIASALFLSFALGSVGGRTAGTTSIVETRLTTTALVETPSIILTPGGRIIGSQIGTNPLIRTVNEFEAYSITSRLISTGAKVTPKPTYPGIWFELPGGGGFGVRNAVSNKSLELGSKGAIDINIPGIPIDNIKF